jgi:hypothetical protein
MERKIPVGAKVRVFFEDEDLGEYVVTRQWFTADRYENPPFSYREVQEDLELTALHKPAGVEGV